MEKNLELRLLDDVFDAFAIIGRGEYVSIYDVKNKITRYSPAVANLFGMSEYVNDGFEKWAKNIHIEDVRRYETAMSALIEGNSSNYDISYRVRLKDGSYVFTRNICAVIRDGEGKSRFIGGIMINEGLTQDTDAITILRNEYGFFQDLGAVVELKKNCRILFISISKMSTINENHGYSFGNLILQQMAWKLQEEFSGCKVYRLEGAKFALLTENLSEERLAEKYEKLRRSLLGGLPVGNVRQVLLLNAGMLSYGGEDVDEHTIYASLSRVQNDSKRRRNGKLVTYGGKGKTARETLELINEVRNCIVMDCQGFSLKYQPIMAVDEKIIAAEALLCWQNSLFGEIKPGVYVPIIERDFLFEELGYWIFQRAMEDGAKLLKLNPEFVMSVNVSPAQLMNEFLIDELEKISRRKNFPLKNLCLELTASCREIEPEILENVVEQLKSRRIKYLLDDFGSGVGSLEFLQRLSPDYVKPVRRYIDDIEKIKKHLQIVRHLVNIAVEFEANVCVKGIASAEIRDIVKKFPIQALQGNFYDEPLSIENLIQKYF